MESVHKRYYQQFEKSMNYVVLILMSFQFAYNQQKEEKPNVILILVDDQGYGDIGALGNPYIKTPNIDTLHGQSVEY